MPEVSHEVKGMPEILPSLSRTRICLKPHHHLLGFKDMPEVPFILPRQFDTHPVEANMSPV